MTRAKAIKTVKFLTIALAIAGQAAITLPAFAGETLEQAKRQAESETADTQMNMLGLQNRIERRNAAFNQASKSTQGAKQDVLNSMR